MSRASAAVVAVALWIGTILPAPWGIAAVGTVLLAVCAGRRAVTAPHRQGDVRPSAPLLGIAAVALVLVGAGLSGGRAAMRDAGELGRHAERRRVELVAMVVTEPRAGPFDSWMIVRVRELDGRRVRQRALLRSRDSPPLGSRIAFRGVVGVLPDNGFGRYVRGLGAGWQIRHSGSLTVIDTSSAWLRTTTHVRDRLHTIAHEALPPDQAGILTGLVTGDGRDRSAEVDDLLDGAGLRHLVVVSGRHTALFLAGILALTMALRLSFRTGRVVTLCALGWFVLLVRWQPSVLRAAAAAALVLIADLLGRDRDTVHVLAMAVSILLLVDPFLGRQLGFLLSVAATAGVVVLGPVIWQRLPGPRWWRVGVGAALGAQLAVAPVLVAGGENVPVAAVAANLVAAPAAAVAQLIGSVGALVGLASPQAARALLMLAAPALDMIVTTARIAAVAPPLADLVTAPLVAAALGITALAMGGRRRLAVGAAVALFAVVWMPLRRADDVAALTVTALDVGQGDAVLVESPGDTGTVRMLVDGGPHGGTLLRALDRRGVRRLDVVVLTHAHGDHSAGLSAALSRIDVGALLLGPQSASGAPTAHEPSNVGEVLAAARRRGVPVVEVSHGAHFPLGHSRVRVLGPPADVRGWESNDRSVVLRVDGRWGDALLTGDVEDRAQRRLLRRPEMVDVELVKVPHHGGATNADGFLDATGAEVAVVSVGKDNDYGHPSPRVLDQLDSAQVWRTDTAGTVRVELGPRGPTVVGSTSARP